MIDTISQPSKGSMTESINKRLESKKPMKILKFKSKELEKQMLSPNESTKQRNIYTNETNDTIDSDISVKVDKKSPNSRKRSVYKSPNVKKSPNELKSKTDNKMIAKNVVKTKAIKNN